MSFDPTAAIVALATIAAIWLVVWGVGRFAGIQPPRRGFYLEDDVADNVRELGPPPSELARLSEDPKHCRICQDHAAAERAAADAAVESSITAIRQRELEEQAVARARQEHQRREGEA